MDTHDDVEVVSMAPSALANSRRLFQTWAAAAHLQHLTSPSEMTTSIFQELNKFILPRGFIRIPTNPPLHGQLEFHQNLRDWSQSNHDSLSTTDAHNMNSIATYLYGLYYSVREAVDKNQNEASQRRGVDLLIQLAFSSRKEGVHDVCMKSAFKLSDSPRSGINVGPTAIADIFVLMPIPKAIMDKIYTALRKKTGGAALDEAYSRLYWQPVIEDENSLIDFCGEFKKRPNFQNRNQLLFDLRTAQSQRRAFGLPNTILWGAVCSAGQFQVFSSNWSDDGAVVEWSAHDTWNLTVPIDFLRCYSFLCSLSNNLSQNTELLKTLNAAAVSQNCTSFPWSAPPRPTKARSAKRARGDDEAEPVAGPSGSGNVADLGPMADIGDSEMLGFVFGAGNNVDGYDDFDTEESVSWNKVTQDWRREAASIPVSSRLSEGLLKTLPTDEVDHCRDLMQWRSLASDSHIIVL